MPTSTRSRLSRSLSALLGAAALAAPATALAAARAELSSPLAAGRPAQLTVTVDGDAAQPPAVAIPDASVRFAGQMSETSIINGASSQHTRFIYTVVPAHAGALDVPAIAVGADTTAPVHADVGDAGTSASAAAPTQAQAQAQAPRAAAHGSSHAFLSLELPAAQLVVGQAVPVTIHAYFRGGVSATLDGAPHLTSDAYTLSNLSDKPAQQQLGLHGEPYLMATWTAVLSPAKPIAGKLAVELPVELAYRAEAPAQHRTLRDVFGADPFDAFGPDPFGGADAFPNMDVDVDSLFDIGPMQHEQVTLRSADRAVTVADPPAAGRPAAFTGAVGHFGVTLEPPTGDARVGEPIALTMRVTGTGNFERVALPGVAEQPGLKTYAVASAFAAAGPLSGTKTFTQTVVPTQAGALSIPGVALAFYDPATHAYATATSAPLQLQIAAAAGGGAADPGLAATVRGEGMQPDRVDPGAAHASLVPLYRQPLPWLLLGAGALAAVLTALVGWIRRSGRLAGARATRRTERLVARASAEMTRAADAHDDGAFFAAARTALQARLAAAWHTAPEAITARDIAARLGSRGDAIRDVFEHADGVAYGAAHATEPLERWRDVVRAELAQLEVSP